MQLKNYDTKHLAEDICLKMFGKMPDRIELCTVGMVNTVYIADIGQDRFVIRLNSEKGAYSESKRLLDNAENFGLPVPRVIGSGSENGYEYLVMSYIPGKDLGLVYHELSRESKKAIAAELVAIQQNAEMLDASSVTGKWHDFIDDMLNTAESRIISGGYFSTEKVSFVREAARQMNGYFEAFKPAAYLDDISTKNLLIKNGHISGIVDIDEIAYGDKLTYIALMRTALLNMGYDDLICDDILCEMNADAVQRKAELFYCLMYCVDFMGERGMTFNGKKVEVSKEVIDRLNSIFDMMWNRWEVLI
jgi:hypothetical protein